MWLLQLRGLQHARLILCLSLSPRICPNSSPLSQWGHPTISSSVTLFSCPQSFPASRSFPIVSSLHHVVKLLQLQLQPQSYQWIFSGLISFRIDQFDLLAVQRTLKSLAQHHSLKAWSSVLSLLYVQLSHLYMPTRKPQLWLYGPMLAGCFLIHCLGLSQLFVEGERSFNFMAAVTICSNFGAQQKKICHHFHFFPKKNFFLAMKCLDQSSGASFFNFF